MKVGRSGGKIQEAVIRELEAGQTLRASDFAARHGHSVGSVVSTLGRVWQRNEDVARKKDGPGYVYYKVTDTAVAVRGTAVAVRAELKAQLDTELAEQEQAAWTVLWESADRILLAADGRVWWAVPLA